LILFICYGVPDPVFVLITVIGYHGPDISQVRGPDPVFVLITVIGYHGPDISQVRGRDLDACNKVIDRKSLENNMTTSPFLRPNEQDCRKGTRHYLGIQPCEPSIEHINPLK
jgi:hypothetical protein